MLVCNDDDDDNVRLIEVLFGLVVKTETATAPSIASR